MKNRSLKKPKLDLSKLDKATCPKCGSERISKTFTGGLVPHGELPSGIKKKLTCLDCGEVLK